MKKALAIFICFSLFLQCVAYLGVIGYYELNKDYIAKNLCENRDQPQKKCCGKCYLRKQLKKVDENDKAPNGQTVKIEKNEVVYLLPVPFFMTPVEETPVAAVLNPLETHFHATIIPTSVFHPPAVSC